MNPNYLQNYTKKDIKEVLSKIHECIRKGRYTVSTNNNRKENINFIIDYNLRDKKIKEIILNIKVEDFCHALHNSHPDYDNEILWVFVPQVELSDVDGNSITADIYTKFNIISSQSSDYAIVISFHKRNKPITKELR